jgi:uncharacterized protein (TIGR03086 family)
MTATELYTYALDQATAVVVQLEPEQLGLPTPDSEWCVLDLLNHMLYEVAWAADIVAGVPYSEVGDRYDGDLLGEDAIASWRRYAAQAQAAVEQADPAVTVHLSYGDRRAEAYLWEAGNDQLIHAWDLGQAIGVSVVFDAVVAQALYAWALTRRSEFERSGLFAPPVTVPASANIQTKLLALEGRSEEWAEVRVR